jgi:hypothetical protein
MNIFELLTVLIMVGAGVVGEKVGYHYYGTIGAFFGTICGIGVAVSAYLLFRKLIGVRK